MVWRPSVRLSVCPVGILTASRQEAACDAASEHFDGTIKKNRHSTYFHLGLSVNESWKSVSNYMQEASELIVFPPQPLSLCVIFCINIGGKVADKWRSQGEDIDACPLSYRCIFANHNETRIVFHVQQLNTLFWSKRPYLCIFSNLFQFYFPLLFLASASVPRPFFALSKQNSGHAPESDVFMW